MPEGDFEEVREVDGKMTGEFQDHNQDYCLRQILLALDLPINP